MLEIDGSAGEGGGQVLRTALGLSLVTQTPFRMVKIRGRRERPGLLRQHLTCVQAAAALGGASVEGDALGSGELVFRPGPVRPGSYAFSVGSAGSTTLVLQAVLPALLRASGPICVAIEGGTHNRLAPPFEFLSRSLVPVLARLGAKVDVQLVRFGFEPAGGGRLVVSVTPSPLRPIELIHRGALVRRDATAIVSSIPLTVATRELDVVRDLLDFAEHELRTAQVEAASPGNALVLALEYEQVTQIFVGLGARAVPAEQVARHATEELRRALRTDAPVGSHLADQLLVPLALAGGGVFRTVEPTEHTRTQLELIPRFLSGVALDALHEGGGVWRIGVEVR